MIRMIATTISSSINEKPFCLRIVYFSPVWSLTLDFYGPGVLPPGVSATQPPNLSICILNRVSYWIRGL
jgi:hypothetical protein